jgi:DNA-binding MarR family transcriptional regulator
MTKKPPPRTETVMLAQHNDHRSVGRGSADGQRLEREDVSAAEHCDPDEAMGYLRRTRDSEDERNVRVSLTEAGRCLREKGFGFGEVTMKVSGLTPEEFPILRKAVANLRDNLMNASKGEL